MIKTTMAFCMALIFSSSAQAKSVTTISDLKSHCNSEGLEIDAQRTQLAPWFTQLDLKLRRQPEYQKLVQDLHSQLGSDSIIVCWVKLQKNGDIASFALNTTTGSETVDHSIENLVRKSAPFNQPTASAYPENILIRIHKAKDLVEIASGLNTRSIKPRIGQNVQ